MAVQYLDKAGVTYLVGKITTQLAGKVNSSDLTSITTTEIDTMFAS